MQMEKLNEEKIRSKQVEAKVHDADFRPRKPVGFGSRINAWLIAVFLFPKKKESYETKKANEAKRQQF